MTTEKEPKPLSLWKLKNQVAELETKVTELRFLVNEVLKQHTTWDKNTALVLEKLAAVEVK